MTEREKQPFRIAALDDYQEVALGLADWSALPSTCRVRAYRDHLREEQAVAERLAEFEAVVAMRERTPFTRSLLEKLPRLRLLVTTGMRNAAIDFSWQTTLGVGLNGRTLGLLGLGRLGAQVARIGLAFGMETLAWSQNLTAERAAEVGARLVARDVLLQRADVLSIHLALGERTRGLLGARELGLMKRTALLVNTSRGPIVDEAALVHALSTGAIAGAGLDVFDIEPLPVDHPLLGAPNAVITPHLGYVTEDTYRIFYGQALENIQAYLRGAPTRVLSARGGS
jgi:phosphoglycerate dehydrogenase-like enzyme